jgi:hypothetical protein
MAKFFSSTFGKISGKHGTAVAAIVKGVSILKVFTPPANPNSLGQKTQRLKFGMVTTALNPLRNIITVGFGSKDGFNQAVSIALRNAFLGNYPDFTINYSKVIVASGSLPQSSSALVSAQQDMNVLVNWDTTIWKNGTGLDDAQIAFLNADTQMVIFVEAQAKRQDGKFTAILPASWKGETIHTWLFFTTTDGQQSSVSQYLGTIVPA